MEQSFVMVKPDGVRRGLASTIMQRFEQKGYLVRGAKLMQMSRELAETHYAEHKERPFFGDLTAFITSGPVFAMVLEGEDVITEARKMIGSTDPKEAAPGTIRGDFAIKKSENIIHGSDSPESAEREIHLFFQAQELIPSQGSEASVK
ncbi:nucleoside-diphosphate kinase [Alkalicoccus chagannorensis]|uniref:nucleoside-diphosphate kinase n=1 Tax=Alkalicoccus chagannorensis TaxID=427072 RepID=UPI00041F5DCF|nr:nucleoside-diphosphate kinase [Alkalicoccus chagannorensis]